MTHGLVFGKFMPVHRGHLALIAFAAQRCDRLTVSISVTPDDPIAPDLRLGWLRTLLANWPAVEVVAEADDFHDPALPMDEATRHWAAFIRRRFPTVTVFFCSEDYGDPLSQHLGLPCIYFDKARQLVPVSATQIRAQPAQYWDFIPEIVRPYFVKKVCLYGPESVGKTTMGRKLAAHYQTQFVREVARDLITDSEFSLADIERIGYAQTEAVLQATKTANRLLICDTDLITTALYSELYLNAVPPVLADLEKRVPYDRYFLLNIDVPWVSDGLRDLAHRRAEMYSRFRHELDWRGIDWVDVSGNWAQRWAIVTAEIDRILV